MTSPLDESVYKLKEFNLHNDASEEARYGAKPVLLEDIKKDFQIKIMKIDKENSEMEFDMIGVGPPIANAIRRILIAEVPTMAIDRVELYNNTSVIPDEVLAHRLGLTPIKVDPRVFVKKTIGDENETATEDNTIQFELNVKCTRKLRIGSAPDDVSCNHSKVYSGDLKFVPIGNQKDMIGDIRPVHEDILIAVMKPGHEIDLKAFCYKNIGREHAKFSPVVIATYKFLPELKLHKDIVGEDAFLLQKCFADGVIKVSKKKGIEKAKVANPRLIDCSRNVYLHEQFKGVVEVCKKKNHYIFTIESSGALEPEVLVPEALNVLKEKCRHFLSELKSLTV